MRTLQNRPPQQISMSVDVTALSEIHRVGSDTVEHRITRSGCPTLWDRGIGMAGISDAGSDFEFVRSDPHFTQILVTTAGRGQALIDGDWATLTKGWAYVTPPGQLHAYHTDGNLGEWEVAWVIIPRASHAPPARAPDRPRLVETDSDLFRAAVFGLFSEYMGKADPAMMESWTDLVRALVSRVAGAAPRDEVIDLFWKRVSGRLSHPWTLAEMSGTLGCSEEHLRRLCQKRYGCSPMRRLLSLRMHHASSLLSVTNLTIAAIGEQVGYENEFAFSNAFKRWSRGTPPSIYRKEANNT